MRSHIKIDKSQNQVVISCRVTDEGKAYLTRMVSENGHREDEIEK